MQKNLTFFFYNAGPAALSSSDSGKKSLALLASSIRSILSRAIARALMLLTPVNSCLKIKKSIDISVKKKEKKKYFRFTSMILPRL